MCEDIYDFTTMDDSGFNFEEDLVFSGEIKPFEYQFLRKEGDSKQTDEECPSAFEAEFMQTDNDESTFSFDVSKLSTSEHSLSVCNSSVNVLNSTCYNEDESCINVLLHSLIGKIETQNISQEICEKSASEECDLIDISQKTSVNNSSALPEVIDNLLDVSLSTFENKMSHFPLSNDDCLTTDDNHPSTPMEEENLIEVSFPSKSLEETASKSEIEENFVNSLQEKGNSTITDISICDQLSETSNASIVITPLQPKSSKSPVQETVSKSEMEENFKQSVEECSSASETEFMQAENNESTLSFENNENKLELSTSEHSLSVRNSSVSILNSTCYNEDESVINVFLHSLIGKIEPQTVSQEICEKSVSEKSFKTVVNANLMDASFSTVEALFGGNLVSNTDFKDTVKVLEDVHQETKECSFAEKCDLIDISQKTSVNDASALPEVIDNLLDASLSTFENQMSHLPLSNDDCMTSGNNQLSILMEEENLIEVSTPSKCPVEEAASKSETEDKFVDCFPEKDNSTITDNSICDQLVEASEASIVMTPLQPKSSNSPVKETAENSKMEENFKQFVPECSSAFETECMQTDPIIDVLVETSNASTIVTTLQPLSKALEEQENLLDISLPNLEKKIDFTDSATNVVCSNILEDEMPENLLSNSDSDSDCGSTNLKTSEKEEALPECQSGKKREASSDLKYSESKLKKPRTFLPVPTSIAKLRSPLAIVNRSVNLISTSRLTESTTKKLIYDDESVMKSNSKIPSLLSKTENLCHSQLSHIRKPTSYNSAKEKAQDKTGIPKGRQIPTNLPIPKSKLNFAANSSIPSLAAKALAIPIGENKGSAKKVIVSRLPKLQR